MYRGLQLPILELDEKFAIRAKISLQGFTSSTLSRDLGLEFALKDLQPNGFSTEGQVPVLFQILFKGGKQFFQLNSTEYSAFPEEEEVLL